MKCMACNNSEMVCNKVRHYHYKESGLDTVYLDGVSILSCPACGEEMVNIPAVPDLHSLIGMRLIKKGSLLTGKEIKFLRKNVGLSARKLAGIIGVDTSIIAEWENGTQILALPNDRLLRLIYSAMKGMAESEIKRLVENSFEEIEANQDIDQFNIPVQEWSKENFCLA